MSQKFGRVDEELNVYVIDNGTERRVGQMPGASADDALAFFERKYQDLAAQVRILEQRVNAKADPISITKSIEKLSEELKEPAAVGDLASLRSRIEALSPAVDQLRTEKTEANKELIAASLAARELLVTQAENLAQTGPKTIWKTASVQMAELFEKWQAEQKNSPKVPKSDADALWKRFSTARKKFDADKRAFFAASDAQAKEARAKRQELVKKAEALAESNKATVIEYRKLLDQWKASGRSNSKSDDALWESFKAAGDKIYAKKNAEQAEYAAANAEALKTKLELLKEAEKIDPKGDLAEAKRLLADIQKRWAAAGRVAKEALRETEDKLRAIEKLVRDEEAAIWRKTDPAAQERNNAVLSQLEASIEKLKAELAKAEATKDAKKIADAKQALETRTAWLEVVKASSN